MHYKLSILFLLFSLSLSAQPKQANNWHFGLRQAVSFATGEPVLDPPSAMVAFEGVTSMSDTSGQLLFYTNGGGRPLDPLLPPELQQSTGSIWNRNHEVMYDTRGEEGGGFSARQSAVAMPDPAGEEGVYYLFTMEEAEFSIGGDVAGQPEGRGLSYFIIDMNLNGGLGGVRTADQRVYTPAYEGLDATPKADGSGYWIVCHDNDDDDSKFIVTELTASGVRVAGTYPAANVTGKLEFSPNGLFLLNAGLLYSFDNETGAPASDPTEIPGISSQVAAFTPDSRFLYTLDEREIIGQVLVRYQVNDPSAEPLDVALLQSEPTRPVLVTAPFQIGPNGNIYFAEQTIIPGGESRYGLSEVFCVSSPTPGVNRYLIDLPRANDASFLPQSLPQYVDAIFAVEPLPDTVRLDTTGQFACGSAPVSLEARESGPTYRWSTGDTTMTTTVTTAGTYCVTITGECRPTVDCQTVNYESTDISLNLLREEDLGCDGVNLIYEVRVEGDIRSSVYTLVGNPTTAPDVIFTGFSTDSLVTVPKPFGFELATLFLTVNTTICEDSIQYTENFEDLVDDRFRPFLGVTSDGEVCDGKDITLEVVNDGSLALQSVRWFDGSTENPRTLTAEFMTEFEVTAFDECGDSTLLIYDDPVAEFCDCEGRIPELITPNGDGTNDLFRLFTNCPTEEFELRIFNRWGKVVFETNDGDRAWDGTKDGTPQNPDLYLYRMLFRFANSEKTEVRDGQFHLIR